MRAAFILRKLLRYLQGHPSGQPRVKQRFPSRGSFEVVCHPNTSFAYVLCPSGPHLPFGIVNHITPKLLHVKLLEANALALTSYSSPRMCTLDEARDCTVCRRLPAKHIQAEDRSKIIPVKYCLMLVIMCCVSCIDQGRPAH